MDHIFYIIDYIFYIIFDMKYIYIYIHLFQVHRERDYQQKMSQLMKAFLCCQRWKVFFVVKDRWFQYHQSTVKKKSGHLKEKKQLTCLKLPQGFLLPVGVFLLPVFLGSFKNPPLLSRKVAHVVFQEPGTMGLVSVGIGSASATSNQKSTFQVEKKNFSISSHEPQKDNYTFHWKSWLCNDGILMVCLL